MHRGKDLGFSTRGTHKVWEEGREGGQSVWVPRLEASGIYARPN